MTYRDLSFHAVTIATYCYEGEHGYFRSWNDRHGWGDPTKARAARMVPFIRKDGTPATAITIHGDRGQKSHREVKREVTFAEAQERSPRHGCY